MKKRALAILLAAVMLLSMSTTAFATGTEESRDVIAKYEQSTDEDTVFSVDIKWDSLTFTYEEETEKVWNPSDHSYTTNTSGAWDKTEASITVTNHSNVDVSVTMTLTPISDSGVTASLSGGTATLAKGVEGDAENAASVTGKVTISGTPNSTVDDDGVKIGSITVQVS